MVGHDAAAALFFILLLVLIGLGAFMSLGLV